ALCMNTKKMQISEIDNKNLTEWPGITLTLSTRTELEDYVDDRIGFREQAINSYIELNDKLFHVMVHPLFMYGKDGHIFYKDASYIAAYQRLNTDPDYLDSFVDFLQKTKTYLESKDIDFLYFLCPDKKTIYSEYFPDSIHVNTANESVTAYMDEKLKETDIEYIIPVEQLLEAKKTQVVYNKLYDATHWNEFGSFLGHKLIDAHIQKWFTDVPKLTEDDYDLTYVTMETLDIAKFPIHDEVPVYTLKTDNSQDATEYLMPYLQCTTTTFYSHYIYPDCPNDDVLLIFTDSYFGNYQRYYNNRFKEVYFVHRQNYDYLQYFVNLVFPDAVIFETAERSITSEMPIMADFSQYYYEEPFDGQGDVLKSDDLSYALTGVSGIRRDGSTLYLDPDEGDNIIRMNGMFRAKDRDAAYDIYVKIGDTYLEADYCALHRNAETDGIQEFSVSVQRRYMSEGPIELIAVDRNTKQEYCLETFEVVYGK
ncbi:MAG TPA: hypothetical protein PLU43_04010, partial [Lachnospiraceae bacterium]|nr:hypothetical protein [Lachnospiraceae bacterium]